MASKEELLELYEQMVDEGDGDLLLGEICENKRLLDLYEERLKFLLNRNPELALVRMRAIDLYVDYEKHFRKKINEFTNSIEAATEVLQKHKHNAFLASEEIVLSKQTKV